MIYQEPTLLFLNIDIYCQKNIFKVGMSNKEITVAAATWAQEMPCSTIRIPLCHPFFCFKVSLGNNEHAQKRKMELILYIRSY